MAGFDRSRMMFNRASKETELNVPVSCTKCDRVRNEDCGEEHDGGVESFNINVVGIPWAKLNYIKSQCISFDDKQQTRFNSQQYLSECLKEMIVDAPWGKTDDMFLLQVGGSLGAELEKIIPSAYGNEEESLDVDFSSVKKE